MKGLWMLARVEMRGPSESLSHLKSVCKAVFSSVKVNVVGLGSSEQASKLSRLRMVAPEGALATARIGAATPTWGTPRVRPFNDALRTSNFRGSCKPLHLEGQYMQSAKYLCEISIHSGARATTTLVTLMTRSKQLHWESYRPPIWFFGTGLIQHTATFITIMITPMIHKLFP